ncbi:MAG: hypothetical protein R3F61_33045 [Myxococcota bacterium]
MTLLTLLSVASAGGAAARPAPQPDSTDTVEALVSAARAELQPGNLFTRTMTIEHSDKGPQSFGQVPAGKYAVSFFGTPMHQFTLAPGARMELTCTPIPRGCTVGALVPAGAED